MTINEFIKDNRSELLTAIQSVASIDGIDDIDGEIELWVMNDESLYNWALDSGVEDI